MKTKSLIFLLSAFILFACSKDENPEVDDEKETQEQQNGEQDEGEQDEDENGDVDEDGNEDENNQNTINATFTVEIAGVAPNAIVDITNTSSGASSFDWEFSAGANIESSTEENPPTLEVDKAGEFTITLTAGDGTNQEIATETVTIEGFTAIVTYLDVEFGFTPDNDTYGRFFSFDTGQIYKDNEINDSNGDRIHLVFDSMGSSVNFFDSPDASSYSIPNATETMVQNWGGDTVLSIDDFEGMENDEPLAGLTISNDNESFPRSGIPNIVLFQLSSGRKGAILTKEMNDDRLIVDIKIQKY